MSFPNRRTRTEVVVFRCWWCLAIVVAVAVAGAVVVARSSGGTSGEHAGAEPPAVVSAQTSPECRVNLDYLAAEVGTMPESVRPGVIAGLSPQVRQLTDRAMANQTAIGAGAFQYGFAYSPPVPDGPTLRGSSPRFRLQMPASS